MNKEKQWIDSNRSQFLKDFFTFLRFKTVSSEEKKTEEMRACVDWLSSELNALSFKTEVWQTSGHPTLFAENHAAGPFFPTLLIYHHYDVQPVDPESAWLSPPFQPDLREDKIYARGAQDNKGQCFYVLQAIKMLTELDGKLPINIKFCIEGEEEIGSGGLSVLLEEKKKELQSDFFAVIDLSLKDAKTPAVTLGIRGIITFDLEVQTLSGDVHSGMHGGVALNPIHVLCHLLDALHTEEGKVAVPHFYDRVKELQEGEKARLCLDFSSEEYEKEMGGKPLGGEKAYTPFERAWLRPTLEINGIFGGYSGEGFKTVIPAKAGAKLSCRLVADQEPEEIAALLSSYLEKLAPEGASVRLTLHEGIGLPAFSQPDSRVVKTLSQAFKTVFGTRCESILSGGSIPVAAKLAKASGGEMVLFGMGLDSDAIHAPNEHFSLDRLEKGILVIAEWIRLLGKA